MNKVKAISALLVVVMAGCGKSEPDVVGDWSGSFSPAAASEMGGKPPAVSLKLEADHTFQLMVGTLTTGHWSTEAQGVRLKAEQRNGKPVPAGGEGQDIVLKLSPDAKTMQAPEQPITFTKV